MGHHGGSWGLPARGTAGPGAATPTFRRRPSPQSDAAPADHARPALSCRLTPEPSTALRPRTHRLRAPSRGREGSGPVGSYPEGPTADAPCSVGGSPSGLRGGVLAGPPCAAHRPNEASPPCPGAHGEDINQAGTRGGGSGGSGVGAAACRLAMKGPVLLALLGLCVTLAAGRRSSVVKDFDFDKVGSSGRPLWGGLLPGRARESSRTGAPWTFRTAVRSGRRGARSRRPCLQPLHPPQFSGFWYEIAFASKLHEPKARKVVAVLVEWEGGHLALTTSHEDETGCVKDKRLAMKGDVPGKFKLPKEFGDKEISVVSTDYETYAIMDVQLHRGAASIGVLKLYSRALEHDKEVLKKFHQAAKDYGLSPKDVHLNTWDSECCAPPAPPRPPAPRSASLSLSSTVTCANLLRPSISPSHRTWKERSGV
ncbi:hypothetical protein QTO34_004918 [Cnephaeus nilssonii]|uniref:Lipocalin/cytosolic fatty-acid binding domain-containing protein n=1 Tax=Cnephaeus nilssonii TaxID=3371016 RepID=A0AA40HNC6_CNENI|nr:hypothetical protein QTO34_004918 [Eptesicus nilssonii]